MIKVCSIEITKALFTNMFYRDESVDIKSGISHDTRQHILLIF